MKLKTIIFATVLSSTLFAFDKKEQELFTELDKTPQIETKTGVYTSLSVASFINIGVYHRGEKALSYFSVAPAATLLGPELIQKSLTSTNFGYCRYLDKNRSVALGIDVFALLPSKYIFPAPAVLFEKKYIFLKISASSLVASILYKDQLDFDFIAATALEFGCRF